MKTHTVLLILSIMLSNVVFANDTLVTNNPKLNIYYEDARNRRTYLKVPDYKELRVNPSWKTRYFYQINLQDTGRLHFFLFNLKFFQFKPSFKKENVFIVPINFTGERWLYISNTKRKLRKLKQGNYQLLTREQFQKEYSIAYRKFLRRGFDAAIRDVPANIEPTKE